MNNEDDKSPRSAFDDGQTYSPVRRKYHRRSKQPSDQFKKKPPFCKACGGEHTTRSCSLGR